MEQDVEFVCHLGDIVDGFNPKGPCGTGVDALDTVIAEFDRLGEKPHYHMLGNHCLYNCPRPMLNERLKCAAGAALPRHRRCFVPPAARALTSARPRSAAAGFRSLRAARRTILSSPTTASGSSSSTATTSRCENSADPPRHSHSRENSRATHPAAAGTTPPTTASPTSPLKDASSRKQTNRSASDTDPRSDMIAAGWAQVLGWPELHPKRERALQILRERNPNVNKNSPEGLQARRQSKPARPGASWIKTDG